MDSRGLVDSERDVYHIQWERTHRITFASATNKSRILGGEGGGGHGVDLASEQTQKLLWNIKRLLDESHRCGTHCLGMASVTLASDEGACPKLILR